MNSDICINAKVILLGESGVGKSGLAIRIAEQEFRTTESTHGAQVWQIPITKKLKLLNNQSNIQAQLTLWDLAGQPDYHLVHQLFLEDTDVALLLFDCSDVANPFRGIPYWAKVLKKLAPTNALKYLVSARCDVSPVTVDKREINQIIGEHGLDGYFCTSAKTGVGIEELLQQIIADIPWDKLPRPTTPKLFQLIHKFLLERKEEGNSLIDINDVNKKVKQKYKEHLSNQAEIDSVVSLLQAQGFIYRLAPTPNMQLLLLRPELINQYASSIIQQARNHPEGIGSIPERDVVCAYLTDEGFEQEKYLDLEQKSILESTVELFIRNNLAFRELGLLVFPSQFNTLRRFAENIHPLTEVTYEFSGCVEAIYASLVVSLRYTTYFHIENLWKYAAEFSRKEHRLGFSMKQVSEGTVELEIYFYPGVRDFDRVTFICFITSHLNHKGIDVQERILLYCPNYSCGKEVTNREAIETRVKAGKLEITCQYCDTSILIPSSIEKKYTTDRAYPEKQQELEATVKKRTEEELKAFRQDKELYTTKPDNQIRILHLSDIHLGTGAQAQQYSTQLALDLTQNLDVKQLNYLVISGDIANCSTQEEYEAAFELVDRLLKRYKLDPNRVIIVPGNHDLNWELSETAYEFVPTRKLPKSLPEGRYIEAGSAGALICDETEYKKRFDYFNNHFYKKIYNKSYPQEYDQQAILHPCPEDKILFLALNSCWEIDHEYKNRAGIHPNAIYNALDQILNPDYSDWLKIAVWHHPVNGFESIKNVAFLEQLAANGFQLGIHGHIHEAKDENFQYDTRWGLRIIAAGTFGAPTKEQVTGIPLQYNLLTLDPESGILTVETRKKEKTDGAWSADARWGDKNNPAPRYNINLQYGTGSKTDNSSNQQKTSMQDNRPNPGQSIFGGNIQVGGNIIVGNITQNIHSNTANEPAIPSSKLTQEQQKPTLTFIEPRDLVLELIATLNDARFQGEEGEQGGTGSFYRYEIYLEDVSYENEQNKDNNQEYKLSGSWSSFVYKYVYLFNKLVDTPWGHNKKPYGNFHVIVKIINGVLRTIRVKADRYNDTANNYAANKVEQLIESKIKEISINIDTTQNNYSTTTNKPINPTLKRTILILASSPVDKARLRLEQEVREIDEGLRRAQKREQFTLEQKWAVRPDDLHRALLDLNPQIVHFSGHGIGEKGLLLENTEREAQLVPTNALANLFKLFASRGVECVVLNACYAEVQADAISQHIKYVVGMSDEISDRAAVKFAVGFYDALGAGWSYEDAFDMGCSAIALENIPEELTPVLKRKNG